MGNPVVGDFKYGRIGDKKICDRMLLHSYRCEMKLEGRGYDFVAPAPAEFRKLFGGVTYSNSIFSLHQ
jgi:23S rRNA-/tRNA-specific pseudouridylate synthase